MTGRNDLIDTHGATTPLCRAKVLAAVLRHVSASLHPINVNAVGRLILRDIDLQEEEVSGDIFASIFLLCDAGIIIADRFDRGMRTLDIGMLDTLRPSRSVTRFIWEGEVVDLNSESSNGCI